MAGVTGSILNVLVQLEGADKVGSALDAVGSALLDTAVKADRMNAMMESASGGALAAARNLDFVRSTSNKLGTDIYASADAFAKLTAATRGTALEGEQTRKIFEAISTANANLGGSTADLTGMLQALSQMVSKGTVSMEELRGQLGERLPGAMKLAADAMDMTTASLIEQISNGEILAEDLLPRLAEALQKTYNDGKIDTAQANLNRLTNEWNLFKQSITNSEQVNVVLKTITNQLIAMRGAANALSGIWNIQGLTGKANVISEEMSRAIYNVEKDPRIEAFKKYQAAQKEFIQEQRKLTELQNQPRQQGSTDRIEKVDEQKKKIEQLSKTYAEAASNYAKYEQQARQANEELTAQAKIKPAYVTETDKFVGDKEVDKLKKFRAAREDELKANEQAWSRAIKQAEKNGALQLEITESFKKREAAINAEYNDKIQKEEERRARPGARAARQADREEAKREREYQAMLERSRDLTAKYENDIMTIRGRTLTDSLQKVDELAKAQIQAEQEALRDKKLNDEERKKNEEKLAEVTKAIWEKAEADKVEIVRKANNRLTEYANSLITETARLNSDRLTELKATHEAELQSIKDRYDREVEEAKRARLDVSRIEQLYNQRVQATNKKFTEDNLRISGGYWEKLSFKIKDSYGESGNFVDSFNSKMVDATVGAADSMANAFVDMAANGKATWQDFAYSVIIEIEKMIAKMLILWGVQQLVGMAGGMIGGETGGLMAKSAGMSPFNGSGPFASFANANGNAFDNGEVTAFAVGGIVDKPTMFPMRRGMGLMGEAGPEAIMPLTRDGNGRLGVRAAGNQAGLGINVGAINVQVTGAKNPEQTGQVIGTAIERQLKQLIQQQVKDAFRPGNTMNPNRTVGGGTVYS